MKPLIDALEGLFASAAMAGGEAGEAAAFVMENVDWSQPLQPPAPRSLAVVDDNLEILREHSGQYGSNAHIITDALLQCRDDVPWNPSSTGSTDPDVQDFSSRYAYCMLIGHGAPLESRTVRAGLSIQGRDTYYPPHAHKAVETYWIIGGDADWKVGVEPWFPVLPGAIIHHETEARHAMQTNHLPLLTVWLWTSHVNSSVMIVRGQSAGTRQERV